MHTCDFVCVGVRICSMDVSVHVTVCACEHLHMCHGAGAKVGWIKEYRGLTFTM